MVAGFPCTFVTAASAFVNASTNRTYSACASATYVASSFLHASSTEVLNSLVVLLCLSTIVLSAAMAAPRELVVAATAGAVGADPKGLSRFASTHAMSASSANSTALVSVSN